MLVSDPGHECTLDFVPTQKTGGESGGIIKNARRMNDQRGSWPYQPPDRIQHTKTKKRYAGDSSQALFYVRGTKKENADHDKYGADCSQQQQFIATRINDNCVRRH